MKSFWFFTLIFCFLGRGGVSAAPLEPRAVCHIRAEVLSVSQDFKEMDIEIKSPGKLVFPGNEEKPSCDEYMGRLKINHTHFTSEKLKFSVGQIIEGHITYQGDEHFDAYTLGGAKVYYWYMKYILYFIFSLILIVIGYKFVKKTKGKTTKYLHK